MNRKGCVALAFIILFGQVIMAEQPSVTNDSVDPDEYAARTPAPSWNDLPEFVTDFRKALLSNSEQTNVCAQLKFPITVHETAYGGCTDCGYYIHTSSIIDCAAIKPVLARLKAVWKDEPKMDDDSVDQLLNGRRELKPCEIQWWGISASGDVEHVWAVGTEQEEKRIKALMLDAENNQWSAGRKDFKEIKRDDRCF